MGAAVLDDDIVVGRRGLDMCGDDVRPDRRGEECVEQDIVVPEERIARGGEQLDQLLSGRVVVEGVG